ncbi:hypothetical protein CLV43_116106 [Umezawaea tangerina]|uniref:Uncharacterized protein n=1 Tax=Umezawaea tangerina TaxID=84725 RepID=A0A2T0SMG8_9PSEU|nr:hypothetical protein CLV43_116106 [Umezawaea tangerina]
MGKALRQSRAGGWASLTPRPHDDRSPHRHQRTTGNPITYGCNPCWYFGNRTLIFVPSPCAVSTTNP